MNNSVLNSRSCDTWLKDSGAHLENIVAPNVISMGGGRLNDGVNFTLSDARNLDFFFSAILTVTLVTMCQMNSALAKLQYLSNQSEFVFAGDNGNPPYQDSNRLRFCNLVAPKPKSVHNLPFWPTEAYQAHRSPLACCHWAACTIMPIGQSAKKATVQRTFPDTSWARSAKDFWYWSHFIPLPLTQPFVICRPPREFSF